ncbi:MAG: MBL fold metallo-hydrolase [Patescibacteria group bacterium]|nr:MBL fold metallo-hydrolase [Patescibacteria group bacterium]
MKLTFYGGVGEVTGANYLVESGPSAGSGQVTRILVDCGLHQGEHFSSQHNWEQFAYDPKTIDAVFVTHAHIDHTGRLPKLVKDGLKGKVYSTPPTRDFGNVLLLDSEHVLLQEAERTKQPPLYGVREVEELMARWEGIPYHQPMHIGSLTITLYNSAHILGASIVVVEGDGKKIAFTGDLGNSPAPLLGSYETLEALGIDYAVIESAYGDRLHQPVPNGIIEDTIEETVKAGGTLMIPAFAMERTQQLLFDINELADHGRIPKVPVFLDSPLAIKVTDIFKRYPKYFDQKTKALLKEDLLLFDFPGLQKTLTTDDSKRINEIKPPKVIIAGSGMSQGGRILHHEKRYLPDPKSTILFVGYQARGSLGRRIQEGQPIVMIHGEKIPVRCRIVSVEGFSAHADQRQLLAWIEPMRFTLKHVFVVQGEEEGSQVLATKIVDDFAVKAEIPPLNQVIDL